MSSRDIPSIHFVIAGILGAGATSSAQTIIQLPQILPFATGANQIPRTYTLPQHPSGLAPMDIVAGDVDADGDVDLFVLGTGLRLYINGVPDTAAGNVVESIPSPPFGTFVDWTTDALGVERVDQIASNVTDGFLADMDLDGDPDLVFGTAPLGGGAVSMLINTRLIPTVPPLVQPLRFRDARVPAQGWTVPFPPTPVNVNAVVPLDVDLDGDIDVVAGTNTGLLLFTNNILPGGTRSFTVTGFGGAFAGDVRGLAVANLDGAGALDLAAAVTGGPDTVFLSSTAFAATALATPGGNGVLGTSIRAGDVDGSGTVDLVIGHAPAVGSTGSDVVYSNLGAGAFAVLALLPQIVGLAATPGTGDLELADLDEDGDLDVVATTDLNIPGARTRLFLNNGAGAFTLSLGRIFDDSNQFSFALASADVDLDLDPDIVIGYWAATQIGLFANHRFQHDADLTIPSVGGTLTLDDFADAGFATGGGSQTFATFTPPVRTLGIFGFVAVDPTWLAFNIQVHPLPSGTVQQTVPVPPLPAGTRFWMQSLILDGVVLRASNITETLIFP